MFSWIFYTLYSNKTLAEIERSPAWLEAMGK